VYLGGGLGAAPHLAHLYTDFLPVEQLFNLTASCLRLFDRYGERMARMKARMKFLIETLGWEEFCSRLDQERERVGPVPLPDDLEFKSSRPEKEHAERVAEKNHFNVLSSKLSDPQFQSWARDSVIAHKFPEFRGVHVRIKLGDLTAERARILAVVARRFSASRLRISIEQNIYLPFVPEAELWNLYEALAEHSFADRGVGTITDVTTCPGSDTCRLGIASAKGLGSALSDVFDGPLAKYAEVARPLRVKISGCPNGCAQHSIANIGFYSAALTHEDRTVPAHFVTVGGQAPGDNAQFGSLLGKFPAKNCVKVSEMLLELFAKEKLADEEFNSFVSRTGTERLKKILEPLRHVPSFKEDPSFYEDYGHEHERFAVRKGIKGECAGSTVAETVPTVETAREWLAQAEAYIYHKEYEHAVLVAYEAAAAAARVPLYQRLVDPFTADEALWEFENLFVLSGQTKGAWEGISSRFQELKNNALENVRQTSVAGPAAEAAARRILEEARSFARYCAPATLEEEVAVA
jgi:sulfite reductase (ferredoxin)